MTTAASNSEVIITGMVFDGDLENVLPGTNIYLSDYDGNFTAGNPGTVSQMGPVPGRYRLQFDVDDLSQPLTFYAVTFSFVGYQKQTFGLLELEQNPWVIMQPGSTDLPPVIITPDDEQGFPWLILLGLFALFK